MALRWIGSALLALSLIGGGSARAQCAVARLAELPVRIENHRAVVAVTLNGAPGRLMIDSGAFFSTLDAEAVHALHLPVRSQGEFEVMGVGGVARMGATTVRSFAIGPSTLGATDFLVGDMHGVGALTGVLGLNILRIADTEYDLGSGVVRLLRPTGCTDKSDLAYWTQAAPGTAAVLSIPRASSAQPHALATVYVNGVPVRATFDTGAPFSSLSRSAAARAGVKVGAPGVEPAGEVRGIGPFTSPSWTARFDSFKIGGEEIKNARLRIADVAMRDFEMLIGLDFFLSHRIYVSDRMQRMWLTYQGGPVFDLAPQPPGPGASPAAATDPDAPRDADGLSRRAAALADRGQFTQAIADLTEAIRLAPAEPSYLRQRAALWARTKDYPAALKDEDALLKRDPRDASALTSRAGLHLALGEPQAARPDIRAAEQAASPGDDLRLILANHALRTGDFDDARAQADLWLGANPQSPKAYLALDLRCEALGLANRDLAAALADCERALRLKPGEAGVLEDRALVRLRRGELDRARADADDALKRSPGRPEALYLRGLLEARAGEAAAAQADIDAATARDPSWASAARAAGLGP